MRQVKIDSMLHYQFKKDKKDICLIKINDTRCSGMGSRGPFLPEEEKCIARFKKNEKVEFLYQDKTHLKTKKITEDLLSDIRCGDDFIWHLRNKINV